ncbi:uncharacterized protein [Fopius arisanus]|uniref:Uncharacterized protein n=2 Tax=Fopius arisanus TaxID=64838 RepID=A0A9R1U4F4_9HYME|nr:PREDICTED: uncharacterized protein LOC105268897 [Fopius arisanus]
MSDLDGADLSSLSPSNIFNKVFADSRHFTSDSANPIHNSSAKETANKTQRTIPLIESNGEENIAGPVDDTLSNEEFDDSTQYINLPPVRNKFEPSGYSTPVDKSPPSGEKKKIPAMGRFQFTKVQINGSTKPVWFPGYIVISSVQPNYLRITANPEAALSEIWRLCRPQNILPSSKLLLT